MSFSGNGYEQIKSMDKFGPHWDRHYIRIPEFWRDNVKSDDTVLIGGDSVWPSAAGPATFSLLSSLPGKKIFIEGNHDKWIRQQKEIYRTNYTQKMLDLYDMLYISESMTILSDKVSVMGMCLCDNPTQTFYSRYDEGVFTNTLHHLINYIDKCKEVFSKCDKRIFLCHYCPMDIEYCTNNNLFLNEIIRLNPTHVLYGHYHGDEARGRVKPIFEHAGIKFINSSSDLIDFKFNLILEY